MPFLIQGTARDIYSAFGRAWMVAPSIKGDPAIEKDLTRFQFIGAEEQLKDLVATMRDGYQTTSNSYTQGNISAGNLRMLFGDFPFLEEEDFIHYSKNFEVLDYAFIDNDKKACGLMLMFRKDNPNKWIIGLIKNTNETPEKREIILLGSEPFNPLSAEKLRHRKGKKVDLRDNQLLKSINNDVVNYFIQQVIDKKGLKRKVHRIKLLALHSGNNEAPNDLPKDLGLIKRLLTDENEVIDQLANHEVKLSAKHLTECLDINSRLYSLLLNTISNIKDEAQTKTFLYLIVAIHETKSYKENQSLVTNGLFLTHLEPILNIGYKYLLSILRNQRLLSFILELMKTPELFSLFLTEWQEKEFDLPDYLFDVYAQASSDWIREALFCAYMAAPDSVNEQRLEALKYLLSDSEDCFKQLGSGKDLIDLLALDNPDALNHLNELLNDHIKPLLRQFNEPVSAKLFKQHLKIHIQEQNPDIIKLLPQCMSMDKIHLLNKLIRISLNPETIQAILESDKLSQSLVNLIRSLLSVNGSTEERALNFLSAFIDKHGEEYLLNSLEEINTLETKELQAVAFIFLTDKIHITKDKRLLEKLRNKPKLCLLLQAVCMENNTDELKQIVLDPQRYRAEEVYQQFKQHFIKFHYNKDDLTKRSIASLDRLSKRLSIFIKLKIDNEDLFENFINNGVQSKKFIELASYIDLLPSNIRDIVVPLMLKATEKDNSLPNIRKMKLTPALRKFVKLLFSQIKRNKPIKLDLEQHQEILHLVTDPALSAYSLPLLTIILKDKKQAQALDNVLSLLKPIEQSDDFKIKDKAVVLNILLNHINQNKMASTLDQIETIEKEHLRTNTLNMIHCFDKIMLLQELKLPAEQLKFVTDTSIHGFQFRKIISRVEDECNLLESRLELASNSKDKLEALNKVKDEYRKDLYTLAYKRLNNQINQGQLNEGLNKAQNKMNTAVNIDRHPFLRKFAMVLSNIVISCCTLGLANLIHQRKTGNCFFFTKPKSAETIEKLNRDVAKLSSSTG